MSEEDVEAVRRELEERSTGDLVSILRNRDQEEWRPEVFAVVASILAARGVSPAEITALGPEGIDLPESQPLVTLGRYFNPVEAQGHRMALEAAGVPAWVSDEAGAGILAVGIGARLQVRVQDEAAAREILGNPPGSAPGPPSDRAGACPRCGSNDIRTGAARSGCAACGHGWPD